MNIKIPEINNKKNNIDSYIFQAQLYNALYHSIAYLQQIEKLMLRKL